MYFELTDEQREVAKQKILEIAKSDTVLNDTTNTWDWLKKAEQDIKKGLPVKEDIIRGVLSLVMLFDMTWDKRNNQ